MDNKESISDREIAEITIMLEFIKNTKDLLHALDDTFHDKIHEKIMMNVSSQFIRIHRCAAIAGARSCHALRVYWGNIQSREDTLC